MKALSFQNCFKFPVLAGYVILKSKKSHKLDYAFKIFNMNFSFYLQLSKQSTAPFFPKYWLRAPSKSLFLGL